MKTLLFALALTVMAPALSSLSAAAVECPVHGQSGAYFTGKTQTMDGHLMYEYKCPYGGGHAFWVRQN